jgi:hypothetical protein
VLRVANPKCVVIPTDFHAVEETVDCSIQGVNSERAIVAGYTIASCLGFNPAYSIGGRAVIAPFFAIRGSLHALMVPRFAAGWWVIVASPFQPFRAVMAGVSADLFAGVFVEIGGGLDTPC